MAQLTAMGRTYRVLSLDSDPLTEEDHETRLISRIMTDLPRPAHERSMFVRTPNGNLVPRMSR